MLATGPNLLGIYFHYMDYLIFIYSYSVSQTLG